MNTRVLGIEQLLLAAGLGGLGEEPLGGTMTAGPHCSDDDGDVKVDFAAPSHVARLQEETVYLLSVDIKQTVTHR
jgi:hypothetical protein